MKKCFPRLPVLDEKEVRRKLKEHIVIRCNAVHGSEIFRCMRYMKDMV
jgi:hypothetical protein